MYYSMSNTRANALVTTLRGGVSYTPATAGHVVHDGPALHGDRAPLVATHPAADLRAPVVCTGCGLAVVLRLPQPSTKERQRCCTVLVLRALRFHADHQPRRPMRQLHGAVGLVDLLATRSRGATRAVVEVAVIETDLHVGRLVENRHGHRARLHPTALVGRRDTLPAVSARLVLEVCCRCGSEGSEDQETWALLDDFEVKDRDVRRDARTRRTARSPESFASNPPSAALISTMRLMTVRRLSTWPRARPQASRSSLALRPALHRVLAWTSRPAVRAYDEEGRRVVDPDPTGRPVPTLPAPGQRFLHVLFLIGPARKHARERTARWSGAREDVARLQSRPTDDVPGLGVRDVPVQHTKDAAMTVHLHDVDEPRSGPGPCDGLRNVVAVATARAARRSAATARTTAAAGSAATILTTCAHGSLSRGQTGQRPAALGAVHREEVLSRHPNAPRRACAECLDAG